MKRRHTLVRELRKALDLTQVQFAKRLKTTQATICKIEQGREVPVAVFVQACRLVERKGPDDLLLEFSKHIWG